MSRKREQILNTAITLFSRDGFHATGVDTIALVANTTKKTLYHHFSSKDILVTEALKRHHQEFVANFTHNVLAASTDVQEQLLAVFDVAHAWFEDNHFYGCMFINAVSEYTETNQEVRKVAQEFKEEVRGFIEELVRAARFSEPEILAKNIALILEGSIVTAQVSGNSSSAKDAKEIVKTLIQTAVQKKEK